MLPLPNNHRVRVTFRSYLAQAHKTVCAFAFLCLQGLVDRVPRFGVPVFPPVFLVHVILWSFSVTGCSRLRDGENSRVASGKREKMTLENHGMLFSWQNHLRTNSAICSNLFDRKNPDPSSPPSSSIFEGF